jgi:hypothetical protein
MAIVSCGSTLPSSKGKQADKQLSCSETRIVTNHLSTDGWMGIDPRRKDKRHYGVDIAVCAREHVVAVADGVVLWVSPGTESDYRYSGGLLVVSHDLDDGHTNFLYVHLVSIRVSRGDRVNRGQKIAEAWTPPARLSAWRRHVHIELLGTIPIENRNPLNLLKQCISRAGAREFVYPVSC